MKRIILVFAFALAMLAIGTRFLLAQTVVNVSQPQFNSALNSSAWFFKEGSDNSISMGTSRPMNSQTSSTFLIFGATTTWNMSYSFDSSDVSLTATTDFHSPSFNWQMSIPFNSAPLTLDVGNLFQGTNDESETISDITINGGVPISGTFTVAAGQKFSGLLIDNNGIPITSLNYNLEIDTPSGKEIFGSDGITPAILSMVVIPSTVLQSAPIITTQPQSQAAQVGTNVTFTVAASISPPSNYQWQFNGQNIPDTTNATLTLNSVAAANSGGYSVIVSNPYGSVTSATVSLAVLDDGANGNTPVQISVDGIVVKEVGKSNLVIVTHGYIPPPDPPFMPSWVTNMADAIQAKVPSGWQVVAVDWALEAWYGNGETPDGALNAAKIEGTLLGKEIAGQSWQKVHLIAHSAGAGLIQAIADQLKSLPNPPTVIQLTFLDPYLGTLTDEQDVYGRNANWSDCYFVQDGSGPFTSGNISQAFNEDVSWVDPAHTTMAYLVLGGGEVALSSHEYPHDFYIDTITNTDPNWCAAGSGFDLSPEIAGDYWSNHPVGGVTYLPCSPSNAVLNPNPDITGWEAAATGGLTDFSNAVYAVSSAEATIVEDAGFELQSLWSSLPLVQSGGVSPMGETSTNTTAWLAVGVSVTNAVNFVQFDAAFTDTNSAQGLLTVYWNTNQIGMVDERVAETNLQTYHFELPGTVSSGLYTLSFRLDSFANSSSIVVTNVATGFVGLTQPIALNISITNGVPLLQLTAATNFTYLIQTSTNLVDWTPTALLLNTNGTAQFMDSAMTNSARFYRATLP